MARPRRHDCRRLPHFLRRREPRDSGSAQTTAPSPDVDNTSPPTPDGEKIVIKTRIVEFTGKVLTGSVLGGAAFCPGGTVRHEHGSLEIGFPAINVFDCRPGH